RRRPARPYRVDARRRDRRDRRPAAARGAVRRAHGAAAAAGPVPGERRPRRVEWRNGRTGAEPVRSEWLTMSWPVWPKGNEKALAGYASATTAHAVRLASPTADALAKGDLGSVV